MQPAGSRPRRGPLAKLPPRGTVWGTQCVGWSRKGRSEALGYFCLQNQSMSQGSPCGNTELQRATSELSACVGLSPSQRTLSQVGGLPDEPQHRPPPVQCLSAPGWKPTLAQDPQQPCPGPRALLSHSSCVPHSRSLRPSWTELGEPGGTPSRLGWEAHRAHLQGWRGPGSPAGQGWSPAASRRVFGPYWGASGGWGIQSMWRIHLHSAHQKAVL